jgi:hypothetical protein
VVVFPKIARVRRGPGGIALVANNGACTSVSSSFWDLEEISILKLRTDCYQGNMLLRSDRGRRNDGQEGD